MSCILLDDKFYNVLLESLSWQVKKEYITDSLPYIDAVKPFVEALKVFNHNAYNYRYNVKEVINIAPTKYGETPMRIGKTIAMLETADYQCLDHPEYSDSKIAQTLNTLCGELALRLVRETVPYKCRAGLVCECCQAWKGM